MLCRYSLIFFRTARNLRLKNVKTQIQSENVIPVGEDELEKLKKRDLQFCEEVPSYLMEAKNIRTIDKSNLTEDYGLDSMQAKTESKKSIHLQDFVLSYPLKEPVTEENQYEYVDRAVTPLNKFNYHKQLRIKRKYCNNILKELRTNLKMVKAPMSQTIDKLPCPLEDITPSPDLISYRNKDKFSVHMGVDGNPKTVGYFVGSPTDPLMRCVPPTNIMITRDSHKLVQEHFQNFIRESPYKTCFHFKEGGVWRGLWVRSNLKGDLMGIIIIFPSLLPEEKQNLKEDLKNYFSSGPGSECGLTSLYLQACDRSSCFREHAPYELISGEPYLFEECLGKKFQISPDSFFQNNTRGAELLFEAVKKVSEISSITTVLDICCGTGIASLLLAPHCRGVIGIDSTASAIEDARINAQNNGIRNTNFICGKAEKILPVLLKDIRDCSDVVAVVNPARSGLHASVVRAIRNCNSINKIIYVTCKPEGNAMKNMTMLCSTLAEKAKNPNSVPDLDYMTQDMPAPFSLRYAIPFDLFPHTAHVEFVMLFERMQNY